MIKYHLKQSPIQWVKKHVKGYQDDHKKNFKDLDQWSQSNVLADQLAKAELRLRNAVNAKCILAGQNWTLCCNGKKITGDVEHLLRNNLHEAPMGKQWCMQFGINEDEENQIDWDMFK